MNSTAPPQFGHFCSNKAEILKALIELGYKDVTMIDVDRNIATTLSELKIEYAINVLHGRYGEDGCVQGVSPQITVVFSSSLIIPCLSTTLLSIYLLTAKADNIIRMIRVRNIISFVFTFIYLLFPQPVQKAPSLVAPQNSQVHVADAG